jgi:hypothetical protein
VPSDNSEDELAAPCRETKGAACYSRRRLIGHFVVKLRRRRRQQRIRSGAVRVLELDEARQVFPKDREAGNRIGRTAFEQQPPRCPQRRSAHLGPHEERGEGAVLVHQVVADLTGDRRVKFSSFR